SKGEDILSKAEELLKQVGANEAAGPENHNGTVESCNIRR
ncbi:hypothetical protein SAMN05216167_14019, partial [Spirosoma endophyticum]